MEWIETMEESERRENEIQYLKLVIHHQKQEFQDNQHALMGVGFYLGIFVTIVVMMIQPWAWLRP